MARRRSACSASSRRERTRLATDTRAETRQGSQTDSRANKKEDGTPVFTRPIRGYGDFLDLFLAGTDVERILHVVLAVRRVSAVAHCRRDIEPGHALDAEGPHDKIIAARSREETVVTWHDHGKPRACQNGRPAQLRVGAKDGPPPTAASTPTLTGGRESLNLHDALGLGGGRHGRPSGCLILLRDDARRICDGAKGSASRRGACGRVSQTVRRRSAGRRTGHAWTSRTRVPRSTTPGPAGQRCGFRVTSAMRNVLTARPLEHRRALDRVNPGGDGGESGGQRCEARVVGLLLLQGCDGSEFGS